MNSKQILFRINMFRRRVFSRANNERCPFCGEVCTTRDALKHHIEAKHPYNIYTACSGYRCKDCMKFFSHKGDIEHHLDKVHPLSVQEIEAKEMESAYLKTKLEASEESDFVFAVPPDKMCVLCYKTLEKEERHEHYKNVHGDGEGFICTCCDEKIVDWDEIHTHIVEKGLYYSYRCCICNKGYHKRFDCKRHIVTEHTEMCLSATLDKTGDLPPDMNPFGM